MPYACMSAVHLKHRTQDGIVFHSHRTVRCTATNGRVRKHENNQGGRWSIAAFLLGNIILVRTCTTSYERLRGSSQVSCLLSLFSCSQTRIPLEASEEDVREATQAVGGAAAARGAGAWRRTFHRRGGPSRTPVLQEGGGKDFHYHTSIVRWWTNLTASA